MREITDDKREEDRLKIRMAYFLDEVPTIGQGESKVELPKALVEEVQTYVRIFEVDDIRDLRENYAALSQTSKLPKCMVKWLSKQNYDATGLKDMTPQEYMEFLALTHAADAAWKFEHNFNQVMLPHVYLQNPRYIKRKTFEACQFDILDRHFEMMPGVYFYRHNPPMSIDDTLQTQLAAAVNASPLTTFELGVQVMGRKFPVFKNGRFSPRGEMLYIHDIQKSDGRGDAPADIYTPSESEPVAVGQRVR